MEHLVALVGHLAWPVMIGLAIWLLRREVRLIVRQLAGRIGNPATEITLGREGIEIRQRVAAPDEIRETLLAALNDDPEFQAKLQDWIVEKGLLVSQTSFIYGSLYESLRRAAVDELLKSSGKRPKEGADDAH